MRLDEFLEQIKDRTRDGWREVLVNGIFNIDEVVFSHDTSPCINIILTEDIAETIKENEKLDAMNDNLRQELFETAAELTKVQNLLKEVLKDNDKLQQAIDRLRVVARRTHEAS